MPSVTSQRRCSQWSGWIIYKLIDASNPSTTPTRKSTLKCMITLFCTIHSDAKQKKHVFLIKKFFFKTIVQKNVFLCFFIIIYKLKAWKCFLILWSAYSCYIQVVKHYIQYVNYIFIDSETNYLMNYNTNPHSNIKLHNYNLYTVNLEVQCPFNQYIHKCPFKWRNLYK